MGQIKRPGGTDGLVIILLGKNPLKTGAYIAVNLHLHESMCHQRHFDKAISSGFGNSACMF